MKDHLFKDIKHTITCITLIQVKNIRSRKLARSAMKPLYDNNIEGVIIGIREIGK